MGSIFFMTEGNNYFITGFNLNKEKTDLWVTKLDGGSVKIVDNDADKAMELHDFLCEIAHSTYPSIIYHKGNMRTNVFQEV